MDEKALQHMVNASGFPFQLRVEHEIEKTEGWHGWGIIGREVPWSHPQLKADGFADLVAEKGIARLVIECKRLKEGAYVFLVPNTATGPACSSHSGRMLRYAIG